MEADRKFISEIKMQGDLPADSYLAQIPVVRYLQAGNVLKFEKNITFFVGENGSGKSTLLEAIAIANKFNPEGGSLSACYTTRDTHSELYEYLKTTRRSIPKSGYFLRAESIYNILSYRAEVFKDKIEEKKMLDYHELSHGEAFLYTIGDLKQRGLYIFDEPETALSPIKLLTFMREIKRLLDLGSQFIIATHSPILMAFPNACIYQFTPEGFTEVGYTDTEHYQVTKDFLACPKRMLKVLFEP